MLCRLLIPTLLLLTIHVMSVVSFAPTYKTPKLCKTTHLLVSSSSTDPTPSTAATSAFEEIKSKALVAMDKETTDQILGNVLAGEFGKRGEAFVVAQVFFVLCILFGGVPMFGNLLSFIFGPLLIMIGFATCALGLVEMGGSLSPWPVATGDDLITSGIFSQVRHPIYAGLLAIMGGFSIATGSATRLLLTVALWYALELKSDYEEEQLLELYAKEYEAYQEQVPGKFFPQELVAILPIPKKKSDGSDGEFE